MSGTAGDLMSTPASASRIASAAGPIRAQWNGALTGRSTARLAPYFGASATARSIAVRAPEITTCPGALSLAASQTSPSPAVFASSCAWARSAPSRAAIAPSPTGTAACMARPRIFKSRAVSARLRAPAAARAEYSPREWPATYATRSESDTPLVSLNTLMAASDTAMSAGWAFSVSVRSASGPSHINLESGCPRASSTSEKTDWAAGKALASSAPMPTAWLP